MEHTAGAAGPTILKRPGGPIFTTNELVRLIGPLLVEQLLATTVGMADTMMVSRCGEAAISGVSLVDMINNLVINLLAALATGGAVVVSQYLGALRKKETDDSAGQLILLSALLGLGLGVFCWVLARPMLRLFYGSIEADVLDAGVRYLKVTALSYPFLALYNAGAAIFRSMGNSKISMQVSVLMNVINIVGNAVCIFGLGMYVEGVAWPTVVSRAVAAVLILAACGWKTNTVRARLTLRVDGALAKRILGIGIPSAFENSLFQAGRILVVSMISLFGTVQIAANAVANNLDGMGCIPGQAIGLAMITVVGRCDQVGLYHHGHFQRGHPAVRGAAGGHLRPVRGDHGPGGAPGAHPLRVRPCAVAGGLRAAQRPAGRQRRQVHHDRLDPEHGGVADRLQLPAGRPDGLRRRGRVDRHGGGLGLPHHLLCRALLQRRVENQIHRITTGRKNCMKLVSWNVNGLRACLTHGFAESFAALDADVFCLQETKMQPGQADFHPEGYEEYFYSAEKKGYSGTACYCRAKPLAVTMGVGQEAHDHEGRVITLEYPGFYLVNCYTPNSQEELKRLDYRMEWEDMFRAYLLGLDAKKPVILCGDLNVAHQEIDIKNPDTNRRSAGFTDEERAKMTALLEAGFADSFRLLHPDEVKYSWWSYRFRARARNAGWRIDYFLVSKRVTDKVRAAEIHNEVLGSDHCPVELDIDLDA